MIHFSGTRILLDIEGTTSSVAYVFDVMFPYARKRLRNYLDDHWDCEELQAALEQVAVDAGSQSMTDFCQSQQADECRSKMIEHLETLMDADAKTTGLKELQGILWRSGFASGALKSHLFDDVPPALTKWREAGRDIRIYSSGSVAAQKLFFAHTTAGDLLPAFSGHYDTRIGPKREKTSYDHIAADWNAQPDDILFLSDITAELDAARQAGFHTGLLRRPGNAMPPDGHGHPEIESFREVVPA